MNTVRVAPRRGFTLIDRLAHSRDVRRCLAAEWYQYATRREADAADRCALDGIQAGFAASGDLNDLLASIALGESFRQRLVTQE